MKNIGNLTMSNRMYSIITENVRVHEEMPYAFTVYNKGVTGGIHYHTSNRIDDITKWANKLGADVSIIGQDCGKIVIEITDPVCAQLERYLK